MPEQPDAKTLWKVGDKVLIEATVVRGSGVFGRLLIESDAFPFGTYDEPGQVLVEATAVRRG